MTSERTIPHLRDVFGLGGYSSNNNTYYNNHNNSPAHSAAHPPMRNDADYQPRYHMQPPPLPAQPHQPQHPHPGAYLHHQQPQLHAPYNYQHQHQQQQHQPPQQFHQQQPPQQSTAELPSRVPNHSASSRKTKRGDNYKTLTPGDVKTLERHLSMKKTIRKKIMRDLQQAFVDDPNEFAVEHAGSDRMRAELNMEALRFGGAEAGNNQCDNFLVMLRDDHTGYGGAGVSSGATMGRQHNGAGAVGYGQQQHQQQQQMRSPASREYDYDAVGPAAVPAQSPVVGAGRDEKPSFWKRLTMKNKSSKR